MAVTTDVAVDAAVAVTVDADAAIGSPPPLTSCPSRPPPSRLPPPPRAQPTFGPTLADDEQLAPPPPDEETYCYPDFAGPVPDCRCDAAPPAQFTATANAMATYLSDTRRECCQRWECPVSPLARC